MTKFDINEWVMISGNKNSSDNAKIRWSVFRTKSGNNLKNFISITFSDPVYNILSGMEERVVLMQHKDDARRMLMIPSANGYKICSTGSAKFFIKCPLPENMDHLVGKKGYSPYIVHSKGKSSTSILEFNIKERDE